MLIQSQILIIRHVISLLLPAMQTAVKTYHLQVRIRIQMQG